MKNIKFNRKYLPVFSIILSMCYFAYLYMQNNIVFFINDDQNIMYSIAGYYTDGIQGDHSFVNYVLSFFIATLYRVCPALPWYGIFHVGVLFTSTSIIYHMILRSYSNSYNYPILGIILLLFLSMYALAYPIILMQFTTTSAIAGWAAITLMLLIDGKDSKKKTIIKGIASVVYMLICFMHRKNTGEVFLCFYVLTIVYNVVRTYQNNKCNNTVSKLKNNKYIYICLSLLICIFSVSTINNYARGSEEWKDFYAFDESRYKMTDYPHDSYSDNRAMYDDMNWDESLYKLSATHWWFFMDDRINIESFNTISDTGYYNNELNLSSIGSIIYNFFNTEIMARMLMLGAIFITILILIDYLIHRKWIDLLYLGCSWGGMSVMLLYLAMKDRLILRAFQVVIFALLSILLYLILEVFKRYNTKYKWTLRITGVGIILILLMNVQMLLDNIGTLATNRYESSQRTLQVEEYAINNPDNMYIYDTSLTFRYAPFTTYEESYPTNLMFWGGMGWNSPTFYHQLRLNDLEELYSDVLFNDNVYYISWETYSKETYNLIDLMSQYMLTLYPEATLNLVDEIEGGINIYKWNKNHE